MSRYGVSDGIVIRRTSLPNGDLIATLLSEHGKWRGVARKGKLPGGNVGRLSLFHDVTVQHYRRREEDLPVLVQVQLNGALPRLSDPAIYPYAHLLAELADQLTVDVHIGEAMYAYLASGLRGLARHPDPEAVGADRPGSRGIQGEIADQGVRPRAAVIVDRCGDGRRIDEEEEGVEFIRGEVDRHLHAVLALKFPEIDEGSVVDSAILVGQVARNGGVAGDGLDDARGLLLIEAGTGKTLGPGDAVEETGRVTEKKMASPSENPLETREDDFLKGLE